jgi:hypothetical protein
MAQVRLELKEWNAEKLLARSTQILEDFAPIIAEEARNQLSLVQFAWDRGTLRFKSIGGLGTARLDGRGVYVKPGKRDILDTGTLRDSQQAPQVNGNSLSIAWTAPYSGLVLRGGNYGAYTNPLGVKYPNEQYPGPNNRPGRDWITPALRKQDPLVFFVLRWRQLSK